MSFLIEDPGSLHEMCVIGKLTECHAMCSDWEKVFLKCVRYEIIVK